MRQERAQSKCIWGLQQGGTVQREVSRQVAFFVIYLFEQRLPELAEAVWLESAYTCSMALRRDLSA